MIAEHVRLARSRFVGSIVKDMRADGEVLTQADILNLCRDARKGEFDDDPKMDDYLAKAIHDLYWPSCRPGRRD